MNFSNYFSSCCALLLFFSSAAIAQNSTCETAIVIDAGTFTAAGPVSGEGFINSCELNGTATNASWYLFSPFVSEGTVVVASCLGGTDTRLSIFTGTCDDLTCVGSNDDSCPVSEGGSNFASSVSFEISAGSSYYIQWDDRWSTNGFDFTISGFSIDVWGCTASTACNYDPEAQSDDGSCIFPGDACDDGDEGTVNDALGEDCVCDGVPPTENSSCADAIAIGEGTFTAPGPSSGEGFINACELTSETTNANWYVYTASNSSEATVTSCYGGTDTRLSIFTGTCGDLTCVDFSDDACPVAEGGSNFASSLTFGVSGGSSYYIQWDDRWSSNGFEFTVDAINSDSSGCTDVTACNYDSTADIEDGSCLFLGDACDDNDDGTVNDAYNVDCVCTGVPPVGNSTCENAIGVNEGNFTAVGPSSGEAFINACALTSEATNANWYLYNPLLTDGTAVVASCLGGTDTRVSIFTGTCDDLTCVASNDDSCPVSVGANNFASSVSFDVITGSSYYIQWDDRWSTDGFDFSISFIYDEPTPGCTDQEACNYDPNTNIDDGSCAYVEAASMSTEDPTSICAGDGIPDPILFTASGGTGTNAIYLITDVTTGEILSLMSGPIIDLETAGEGTCDIYLLNYDASITTGLEVGNTLADIVGCAALSNAITVIRNGGGCTDPTASNYDEEACFDDDTCIAGSECLTETFDSQVSGWQSTGLVLDGSDSFELMPLESTESIAPVSGGNEGLTVSGTFIDHRFYSGLDGHFHADFAGPGYNANTNWADWGNYISTLPSSIATALYGLSGIGDEAVLAFRWIAFIDGNDDGMYDSAEDYLGMLDEDMPMLPSEASGRLYVAFSDRVGQYANNLGNLNLEYCSSDDEAGVLEALVAEEGLFTKSGVAVMNKLNIYPNPSQDRFVITSEVEMTRIEVLDITGRSISNESLLNNMTKVIDLGAENDGIYLVRITYVGGTVSVSRVTLQK